MKNKIVSFLSVVAIAVTIIIPQTGCSQSPLYNHKMENERIQSNKSVSNAMFFAKVGLAGSITWTKMPNENDTGEFLIKFWNPQSANASGPFVDPGLKVAAKLWMPSMGHGSSPVKVVSATDSKGNALPGQFRATQVYFVMGGKWEIWVQLLNDANEYDKAKIDIEIP